MPANVTDQQQQVTTWFGRPVVPGEFTEVELIDIINRIGRMYQDATESHQRSITFMRSVHQVWLGMAGLQPSEDRAHG